MFSNNFVVIDGFRNVFVCVGVIRACSREITILHNMFIDAIYAYIKLLKQNAILQYLLIKHILVHKTMCTKEVSIPKLGLSSTRFDCISHVAFGVEGIKVLKPI